MPPKRPLVDGSLVDEALALRPEERLRRNDRFVAAALELRRAFSARKATPATPAATAVADEPARDAR